MSYTWRDTWLLLYTATCLWKFLLKLFFCPNVWLSERRGWLMTTLPSYRMSVTNTTFYGWKKSSTSHKVLTSNSSFWCKYFKWWLFRCSLQYFLTITITFSSWRAQRCTSSKRTCGRTDWRLRRCQQSSWILTRNWFCPEIDTLLSSM